VLLAAALCLAAPDAATEAGSGWVQSPIVEKKAETEPIQEAQTKAETAQVRSPAETQGKLSSRQAPLAAKEAETAPMQSPDAEAKSDPVRPQIPAVEAEVQPVRIQNPETEENATPAPLLGSDTRTETEPIRIQDSATEAEAEPAQIQSPPAEAKAKSVRPRVSTTGAQSLRLFQSAAFRGNFNALPKWKRVLAKAQEQIRTLNACGSGANCPPGATSWQRVMKQAKGQNPMAQLKLVTAFFNKWPYRLDQDAYGASDWWATPQEFLKISGDCEDYAIIKYFALRELGFAQDDLRIVVVKDRIRGIGHAVLTVFLQGDAFVLDSNSDAIFPHGKYKHYIPQYSLNEQYRWSHIPLAKQP